MLLALTSLDLGGNAFGDAGAASLAPSLALMTRLRPLPLSRTRGPTALQRCEVGAAVGRPSFAVCGAVSEDELLCILCAKHGAQAEQALLADWAKYAGQVRRTLLTAVALLLARGGDSTRCRILSLTSR